MDECSFSRLGLWLVSLAWSGRLTLVSGMHGDHELCRAKGHGNCLTLWLGMTLPGVSQITNRMRHHSCLRGKETCHVREHVCTTA